jgi:hypothetical protein
VRAAGADAPQHFPQALTWMESTVGRRETVEHWISVLAARAPTNR